MPVIESRRMANFNTNRRRLLAAGLAGAAGLLIGRSLAAPSAFKVPSTKAPKVPKKVFAHYMVCCPVAGGGATVEDFKKEIQEAQKRGLDGFALNCGGWDKGGGTEYKPRCVKIYEAAKQLGTGFLLFVSMDYCCGNYLDETRDAIQTFRDHPNQFKIGGKPVLSTYGGEGHEPKPAQEKIALVRSLDGFFVPFFFGTNYGDFNNADVVAEILRDYGAADGYFFFGTAGSGDEITQRNHRLCQAWQAAGKVFMAAVTPYYRSFGRLNETRGFRAMAQEWEGAIRDGADWIEITTWNDWNEKTYVAPFGKPTDTMMGGGTDDGYGPVNYAHVAYLDASRYYIDWFKTGKPPRITRDRLFYFYRPEPKSAAGKQLSAREVEKGVKSIDGADRLEDSVFATCFLAKPALLTIHSGTTSRAFVIPAGIHHVDMPFALGAQRFTLTRNGHTLLDKTGEQEIADRQGVTRYNYFAGEA
ncbi:MAG: glycoside hydrolase family 71 protein [Armatimonadota bacterium]|nr:glycoside hydrolase family 71 protein [Armatimonadota bacterium]